MSNFKQKLELDVELAELKAQEALNSYPSWEKWFIIGSLFLIVPGYFIAKIAANSYYASHYKSLLLTAHPSFSDAKPPEAGEVAIMAVGQNDYAAMATVTNHNLDIGAQGLSYTFKFYADNGSEAAEDQNGTFYLLPNQTKYLIAPKVSAERPITRAELELSKNIDWQKKQSLPDIPLLTSAPKIAFQSDPESFVLEGSLTNSSPYFVKQVRVTFLLYDFQGRLAAASFRTEFSLNPFEKRDYKHLWPGLNGANIKSVKALAETNLLDKNNLSVPEVPSTGAGGLGR